MAQQQGRNVLDNYVTVAERVASFYQSYPTGRITTNIIEEDKGLASLNSIRKRWKTSKGSMLKARTLLP